MKLFFTFEFITGKQNPMVLQIYISAR